MVFIYKFCKTNLIQPLGEPREHHLGEVRAAQNFIKGKITGRVNIHLYIYELSSKKFEMKSHRTRKTSFLVNHSETFKNCAFLCPVTSILTFLKFQKISIGNSETTISVLKQNV